MARWAFTDWRLSSPQDAAASLRKVPPGLGSCAGGRTGSGSGRNRRRHIPSELASEVLKTGNHLKTSFHELLVLGIHRQGTPSSIPTPESLMEPNESMTSLPFSPNCLVIRRW